MNKIRPLTFEQAVDATVLENLRARIRINQELIDLCQKRIKVHEEIIEKNKKLLARYGGN